MKEIVGSRVLLLLLSSLATDSVCGCPRNDASEAPRPYPTWLIKQSISQAANIRSGLSPLLRSSSSAAPLVPQVQAAGSGTSYDGYYIHVKLDKTESVICNSRPIYRKSRYSSSAQMAHSISVTSLQNSFLAAVSTPLIRMTICFSTRRIVLRDNGSDV